MIGESQHGFRKGRCCLTNPLTFIGKVMDSLDSGQNADVILLDFAKASGKASHQRLTVKLERHGFSDKIKDWIIEWLRGRKQRTMSDWLEVLSGVPHGSVLGA